MFMSSTNLLSLEVKYGSSQVARDFPVVNVITRHVYSIFSDSIPSRVCVEKYIYGHHLTLLRMRAQGNYG